MPIVCDYKYTCGDTVLHGDTPNCTQQKDSSSLLNDIKVINNSQEINGKNKDVNAEDHESEILLSDSDSVKQNNKFVAEGKSNFFTLKRVAGLILSVTGIMFFLKYRSNVNHKDNQTCLSNKNITDLLNHKLVSDIQNIATNTNSILPLNLYRNENSSHNNLFCNGVNLTQHEYLKEIALIDHLSLPNLNQLYKAALSGYHKRIPRSITLPSDHQVDVTEIISNIINNTDIDWRIREEFRGIYHKAINIPEINQVKEGTEKNVKLVLACVSLMLQYLHENKVNNLSKVSFIYGIAFIESLLLALDNMKASELGIIDKRYNQTVKLMIGDIYSNKEIKQSNNYPYIYGIDDGLNEKPLNAKDIYFYSTVRNAVLETKNVKTVSPEPEKDDVRVVPLNSCQIERENLTLSNSLRQISKTIREPLLNIIKETRIVYQYVTEDEGCPAPMSTETENSVIKVNKLIDTIMSLDPLYGRGRAVFSIAAYCLDTVADGLDGNDLSLETVSEIDGLIRGLVKDIVSSLSTQQVKDMDSSKDDSKIKKMMEKIKFKNNKLTIKIENPNETVYVTKNNNNFVDEKSKKTLYFDSKNYWYISKNEIITNEGQNILKVNGYELYGSDISIIKNSSPELYGDGMLIKSDGIMKVLVKDQLFHVSEMYVRDKTYRYVAHLDVGYTPVINTGGYWYFEKESIYSVSDELAQFLGSDKNIKSKLISNNIIHADVTPMRPAKSVQFDGHGNKYLKFNDGYYLLRDYVHYSNYIEGEYNILPVEFNNERYNHADNIFGDMYNYYQKEINVFPGINEEKKCYLDSSILKKMSEKKMFEEVEDFISLDKLKSKHVLKPSEIDGAISIDGVDFIIFDNKLIKITSNNDDTFLLGNNIKIRAYKNTKKNIYYYISDESNNDYRSQNFKLRDSHCVAKRQLFSICNASFYESKDITALLKRNANYGIHSDKIGESLERYKDVNGFYKDKNPDGGLYFLSQDGFFFHVREETEDGNMIPTFFKLYGKKPDDSIDSDFLISDVSIIKDFDTKELIVTTPLEAMQMVFNLEGEKGKELYRWSNNESRSTHMEISGISLDNIQSKIENNEDLELINRLFHLNGKKVITSVKNSDNFIELNKELYLDNPADYEFKSMSSIYENSRYSNVLELFNEGFSKAKYNIKKAHDYINENNSLASEYVSSELRISSPKAQALFLKTLSDKLKRMNVVLDESDKSNIVLVMNNKKDNIPISELQSSDKYGIIGFAHSSDPLDRVYIKTDMFMPKNSNAMASWEKIRAFEINSKILSNTICHESVHALGTPEDYFYHHSVETGELEIIGDTLARIGVYLRRNKNINSEFYKMCSLYFMSNPVYKSYDLNSLLKPEVLSLLFQFDDYLRALILVNNPDTITVIVNDLSKG